MPILFVILIYLVVMVLFLPGRNAAFAFLFTPNFGDLPWEGVLEAVGHAFFTLSLGMGVMITYGSYMRREESIAGNASLVVFLDTFVAICACIIMYTIIFTAPGVKESVSGSTVGMLFITLPDLLYTEVPFGSTIAPIFYILVAFAALSSTISLLEVIVSLFIDKLNIPRHKATFIGAAAAFVVAIFSALSLGAVSFFSGFSFFGPGKEGVLSTLDHLAANWLLPVGGLLTTIFVGWRLDKKLCEKEVDLYGPDGKCTFTYKMFRFFLKFTAPIAILAVILAVIFLGKDFS
jgi:NSS family neurotransmitter:Na+ symporter